MNMNNMNNIMNMNNMNSMTSDNRKARCFNGQGGSQVCSDSMNCVLYRREQTASKREKAKKKYNDKRIGRGQGRLGKVARSLSSSKSSWSETRQSDNVRKDSRRNRNMKKTVDKDVKLVKNKQLVKKKQETKN